MPWTDLFERAILDIDGLGSEQPAEHLYFASFNFHYLIAFPAQK
jgi:hypothetical protein